MWWAEALVAILLVPLIALKSFAAYQLLQMRTEAPVACRSVLLAWATVCLGSVGINLVLLGGTLFVATHPESEKSDVLGIFSLLVLCLTGMLLAGLRYHQLRSRLDPEADAFIREVHVPLPWRLS
jgi:hypothetical protein